jgi:hypothetical protein
LRASGAPCPPNQLRIKNEVKKKIEKKKKKKLGPRRSTED